jgi:hypothetical protein
MENDKYFDNKEIIITFIKKVVEMHPDYVIQDDLIQRFNKKYVLREYISLILEEFSDGLHFSEINKKLTERFNIDVTNKKVHMNLTHFPWIFMNIGLWLYTLKSNTKYSSEKTGDLIYLYLKNYWEPKSVKEISEYVLNRKKIAENTVHAAIEYPNELRFVFLDDGKVWLKEWWLPNLRRKRDVYKYEVPLTKGFWLLLENNELPKTFTLDQLINIFKLKFGDSVSINSTWYRTLLSKKIQDWVLTCDWSKRQKIYILI